MTSPTRTPTRTPPPSACPARCAGLCTDQGFDASYRRHHPRLLARARALTGDPQLAEDAVHDAFLKAWAACGSFDPTSGPPLIGWLTTITRNVVIDQVRARAARPGPAPAVADTAGEPADHRAPMDDVVLRNVLVDALASVSEQHRAVVVRTVVHDRTYTDVAAELGVPVGTVKSRVFYALRGLRAAIGTNAA